MGHRDQSLGVLVLVVMIDPDHRSLLCGLARAASWSGSIMGAP
jgi:hypothetical protein